MKLKNIISRTMISLAVASTVGLTSCDYLDIVPPEQVGVNDAMENLNNATGFLYSCYNAMTRSSTSCDLPYLSYVSDLVLSTDDVINPHSWSTDYGANGYPGLILLNTASASNNNPVWTNFYNGIGQCYLFLEKMDECNIVARGIIDESEARVWRAEAKALIAYYHFALLRRYGPIVISEGRTPLSTPTSRYAGRSHFDYCVDWIADQLDEAAQDLPDVRSASETGRMTATICKAIKAQMFLLAASPLWNGKFPYADFRNDNYETPGYGRELVSRTYDASKWQRAYDAADEAIKYAETKGNNAIYTDDYYETVGDMDAYWIPGDVDENFKKAVWRMRYVCYAGQGEGNHEAIWEMLDKQSGYMGYTIGWLLNPTSPANLDKQTSGEYQSGNGAMAPSLNAVKSFLTKDGYLPENDPNFTPEANWYKSAGIPAGGKNRDHVINLCVNREPRFYAWVAFDGGDMTMRDCSGEHIHLNLLQYKRNTKGMHGYNPGTRDNNQTGFYNQKFTPPTIKVRNSGWYEGFMDMTLKVIRLSELYLIRAEAAAQLGKTTEALNDVNVIRNRAGVPDLTEDMIGVGGMSLVDWILNERRIEFWAESHRYFDIRRYVNGEKYLGYGKRMGLNAIEKENPTFEEFNQPVVLPYPYTWGNKLYLYPIPQNEVYANPQCIQNPGY